MDPRIHKLADLLVNYSAKVASGEKVYIQVTGASAYPLVKAVIDACYAQGARPYLKIEDATLNRSLYRGASKEQLDFENALELEKMKSMDAYIAIRAADNMAELADVPQAQLDLVQASLLPVQNQRVNHSKWVVLRYPNYAMAQLANTSLEAFTDFYFDVCTLDYRQMSQAMDALVTLLNTTDRVHIKGPGTDLTFSIKDVPAIKCDGERNIPDGEVYTAPVKHSVNGTVQFNTPALYQGFTFENISLTFVDGKIVQASANDSGRLNAILDIDEGARYLGEFALGVNPLITKPMKDTLFDEKIKGSIHLTPGMCYEEASNGNTSAIHWDLVLIQTPEFGGGEIYFDDVLVRKDGLFVLASLLPLNFA